MANNVDDTTQTQDPETGQDTDYSSPDNIDLSSLAGATQPGAPPAANLPGGIAAPQGAPPPGPGMQPRPAPTVSEQAQSHGGLLTGLTGVLLDGLSAGMQAQAQAPLYGAPGSTFAQGFTNQQNMPLIKQQKQQAMWDSLTKVEQDKALMAKSYMDQMAIHMQSMRLSDDVVSGMMDSDRVMADQALQEGWGTRLAVTHGPNARREAMDMTHDARIKDTNFQHQYFAYPLNHDDEGHATDYQMVELDPNATLKEDQNVTYPYADPVSGEIKQGTLTVHAGTRVKDFIATREALLKGAATALPGAEKTAAKAGTDMIITPNEQGQREEMTRADAERRKLSPAGTKVTPQEETQNAFNTADFALVQKQLSQLKNAVNDVGAMDPNTRASQLGTIQTLIQANDPEGLFRGEVAFPGVGKLTIPVLNGMLSTLDRVTKTQEFLQLDPKIQNLWRSYQFMLAETQVYDRAVTNSARAATNTQMAAAQKVTIPNPYEIAQNPSAFMPYLDTWQDNIDEFTKRVLFQAQGVPNVEATRSQFEKNYRTGGGPGGAPAIDWGRAPQNAAGADRSPKDGKYHFFSQDGTDLGAVP